MALMTNDRRRRWPVCYDRMSNADPTAPFPFCIGALTNRLLNNCILNGTTFENRSKVFRIHSLENATNRTERSVWLANHFHAGTNTHRRVLSMWLKRSMLWCAIARLFAIIRIKYEYACTMNVYGNPNQCQWC